MSKNDVVGIFTKEKDSKTVEDNSKAMPVAESSWISEDFLNMQNLPLFGDDKDLSYSSKSLSGRRQSSGTTESKNDDETQNLTSTTKRNTLDILRSKLLKSPARNTSNRMRTKSFEEMEKIVQNAQKTPMAPKILNKEDYRHNEWKSLDSTNVNSDRQNEWNSVIGMYDKQSPTFGEFEQSVESELDNLEKHDTSNIKPNTRLRNVNSLRAVRPLRDVRSLREITSLRDNNSKRDINTGKSFKSMTFGSESPVKDIGSTDIRLDFNKFMDGKTMDSYRKDDTDFFLKGLSLSKPENIPSLVKLHRTREKNQGLDDRYHKNPSYTNEHSKSSIPIEMPPLVETPVRKSKRQEMLKDIDDHNTKDPLEDKKSKRLIEEILMEDNKSRKDNYELRPQGIIIYDTQLNESDQTTAREIGASTKGFEESEEKEDNIRYRTNYDDLIGRTIKGKFDSGWYYGKIDYYNTQLKEYKVTYEDESTDYITKIDFGDDLKLVKENGDDVETHRKRLKQEAFKELQIKRPLDKPENPSNVKNFLRSYRTSVENDGNESGYETDFYPSKNTGIITKKTLNKDKQNPSKQNKTESSLKSQTNQTSFHPGDVVWCKWWDNCWWAAKVIEINDVPDIYYRQIYNMYKSAKKNSYYVVKFYVDDSYSKVHKDKIEFLGETEKDIHRSKNNSKEYSDAIEDKLRWS